MTFRVVVLVSGAGTLLQALLDADDLGAEIVAVGSDNPEAYGLQRAEAAGVATFVVRMERFAKRGTPERLAWDERFTAATARYAPDLVVLAGFMKLFDRPFLHRFEGRILNSHPALLPAFPGAHAVRDALAAGVAETGCSLFWVDDGVDTGRIVASEPVAVLPGDTEATLHERIKIVERRLLVDTVRRLAHAAAYTEPEENHV